jgi:hypothetical protein
MTLCWIANRPSSAASMAMEAGNGPAAPLSIVLGNGAPVTNPIA